MCPSKVDYSFFFSYFSTNSHQENDQLIPIDDIKFSVDRMDSSPMFLYNTGLPLRHFTMYVLLL